MEQFTCPTCGSPVDFKENEIVHCPKCQTAIDYTDLPWYFWLLFIVFGPLVPFIYWIVQKKKAPVRAKYAGYIAIAMLVVVILSRFIF